MHQKLSNAIIQALCYSDIFNYPLTKEEIGRYLVNSSSFTVSSFGETIQLLLKKKRIIKIDNYFCLSGREEVILLRKERERISEEKIHFAKKIARILCIIPSISFIGLSGSLAMKNSTRESD